MQHNKLLPLVVTAIVLPQLRFWCILQTAAKAARSSEASQVKSDLGSEDISRVRL